MVVSPHLTLASSRAASSLSRSADGAVSHIASRAPRRRRQDFCILQLPRSRAPALLSRRSGAYVGLDSVPACSQPADSPTAHRLFIDVHQLTRRRCRVVGGPPHIACAAASRAFFRAGRIPVRDARLRGAIEVAVMQLRRRHGGVATVIATVRAACASSAAIRSVDAVQLAHHGRPSSNSVTWPLRARLHSDSGSELIGEENVFTSRRTSSSARATARSAVR